jgi:hypothetical protein
VSSAFRQSLAAQTQVPVRTVTLVLSRSEECSSDCGQASRSIAAAGLRSQQQGEILALMLGDPDREPNLIEISNMTGTPPPSVYRKVQRAELAGLVTSRRVGKTRLVRADAASPYYAGLADILTEHLVIFTSSAAGNRSTLISLAKFEGPFNRHKPVSWAAGGSPLSLDDCPSLSSAIGRSQRVS